MIDRNLKHYDVDFNSTNKQYYKHEAMAFYNNMLLCRILILNYDKIIIPWTALTNILVKIEYNELKK